MELENRMASGRCVPATFGRACRYDYQEGRSRTRRRLSHQLDLRTTERQRQEVEDLEDYVVVRPCRCRAQARSRRTRAQRSCSRASAGVQRSCVLMSSTRRPSDDVGGPFFCPAFLPQETNLTARAQDCRGYASFDAFRLSAAKKHRLLPATVAAFVFSGRSRERVPAFLFAPSLSLGVRGVRPCPLKFSVAARCVASKHNCFRDLL